MCEIEARIMHDVRGAAKAMSISRSSVFLMMQRGELPSLMIAGRRLIAHDDLLALVNRMKEESVARPSLPATLELQEKAGDVCRPQPV